MQLFHETLYKRHSNGTTGSWTAEVIDNQDGSATLFSKAVKVLGGKEVSHPKLIHMGKNQGRANATTPTEQAVLEAKAKVAKKMDGGYVKNIEDASVTATNGLGFIKPMLAKEIEKVKNWTFPVVVSAKLDGHRLLATVKDGQAILYSRQGKIVDIAHIQAALQRLYDQGVWDGTTLDGEAYVENLRLQKISSLIKKPKPESIALRYFIYDIDLNCCYSERFQHLNNLLSERHYPTLSLHAAHTVNTHEHLNELHAQFISAGYEGTIVRTLNTGYMADTRSASLLKKKDFQDQDYKVLLWRLGTPKITHDATYQLPVFTCVTDKGVEFECTAPGTMKERHAIYEKADQYIGKSLTVKFFELTERGAPFLPVALRFREDI